MIAYLARTFSSTFNGCQIHYDTGTFVVGHTEIPIRYCKIIPGVCKMFLSDDIQVEPGTELVIEAKLENGYGRNTGIPGILEESRELRGKSEINIAFFSDPQGWTDHSSSC